MTKHTSLSTPWWKRGALFTLTSVIAGASQVACPPPPAPAHYEWQPVLRRLPGGLLSVWGTSERDVYVVGADSRDGLGPQVLHYSGTEWRRMDTGVSRGDLWWVAGVGNDAVFMVGAQGLILRYVPSTQTFTRMMAPSTDVTLFGVWGASTSDVWAVGGNVVPGGSTAVIWHFDGTSWQNVTLPQGAGDATLFKVWGAAANDVWAIGQNSNTLHWDGSAWTLMPVTDDLRGRMLTVHGNARQRIAVGGTGSAIILEGAPGGSQAWQRAQLPDGTPALNGVFVPPADSMANPVAVGISGTVLHRSPEHGWQVIARAPALSLDYHAVWIDPTGGVWAVGGQIVSAPQTDGMVYHFGTTVPDAPMTMDPSLRTCPTDRGSICTWAGTGIDPGFNGDGHDRRDSTLYWPIDMEFSPTGQPFVLDWNNHRVRRVDADDTFHTIIGTEIPGDGDPMMTDLMPPGAVGTDVALNHPTDLNFAADGTLVVMAWHNHKIRRWDPMTGRVVVMAGRGPGFAGDGMPLSADTRLKQPSKMVIAADGTMYFLDQGNLRVRRIAPDGTLSTIAGTGMRGFAGDGGPALMAQFSFQIGENPEPEGALALSPDGQRLFVADTSNHRIRVIDLMAGTINTVAGTGQAGFNGDNMPAAMAQLSSPRDLEMGPDGALFIADTSNHCVRRMDLTSMMITTVAGTCGQYGFEGDRGPALQARLQRPFGIAFDRDGNLYIADTYNNRIRRVVRSW